MIFDLKILDVLDDNDPDSEYPPADSKVNIQLKSINVYVIFLIRLMQLVGDKKQRIIFCYQKNFNELHCELFRMRVTRATY